MLHPLSLQPVWVWPLSRHHTHSAQHHLSQLRHTLWALLLQWGEATHHLHICQRSQVSLPRPPVPFTLLPHTSYSQRPSASDARACPWFKVCRDICPIWPMVFIILLTRLMLNWTQRWMCLICLGWNNLRKARVVGWCVVDFMRSWETDKLQDFCFIFMCVICPDIIWEMKH